MDRLDSVRRELAVVESLLNSPRVKGETHRLLLELKQTIERELDSIGKKESAAAAVAK
jgi:hypothetical protein